MAVQNLTASQLYAIQAQLAQTFDATLYEESIFQKTPNTLVGLAEKQTARLTPIRNVNNGNQCEGYEAHFLYQSDGSTYTISGTAVNQSCTIGEGEALTSADTTFSNNWYSVVPENYRDTDCNNLYRNDDVLLRATLLIKSMHKTAISLNQAVITSLNTNKQTATYSSDVGVISGGDVYISDLNLWKPKSFGSELLPYFDDIAEHEGLPEDYLIVGGSILANAARVTDFTRLNSEEVAEGAIMDEYADKMIVDRRGFLDASLSESLFLVDPRVYGIYTNSIFGKEMVPSDDQNNTVEFSLPFQYIANGNRGTGASLRNFMFRDSGIMTNARLDFRHQKVCIGYNSEGYRIYQYKFERTLTGAMLMAPDNGTGRKGIVKITRGTP